MNRKEETIQLLHHLIELYENKPEIADIRLGQLLINAVPEDAYLYNVEAEGLQKRIDTMLNN
jgi:hypothetical protein